MGRKHKTKHRLTNPATLGTEKITTLLSYYAVPAVIAMITASLYNIVDSIFIGRGVGPYAIAGLAVALPLMNISTALGTLVGSGASALIAIKLGRKDLRGAEKVLANSMILKIVISIVFMILGIIFLRPILRLFGAGPNIMPHAYDYMLILLLGNVITHLYFGLLSILRTTGYPRMAMFIPMITVVTNGVLDALFIFVFKMGIKGAALATVIAQIVGFIIVLQHFFDKESSVHFTKESFIFDLKLSGQIISIGLPSFLLNIASSAIVIIINNQLNSFGPGAIGELNIGAFGIINRVDSVFIMITIGISQGAQPIVGFNYGAKKFDRVKSAVNLSFILATIVCTIGFIVFMLFPRAVCSIFTHDPVLLDISAHGLWMSSFSFFTIGVGIMVSMFFQSIGKPKEAIFISLIRQIILLIPMLYILPIFFDIDGVWLAMPISDFLAVIISGAFYIREVKKFRKIHNIK